MAVVIIEGGVVIGAHRDVPTMAAARRKYPHLKGALLKVGDYPPGTLFANGKFTDPPQSARAVRPVSKLQIVRALRAINRWTEFKESLRLQSVELQEDWMFHSRMLPKDFMPFVVGMGLTTKQVNSIFLSAATM